MLTIQHIVAQRDVEFSNSMIEAANKISNTTYSITNKYPTLILFVGMCHMLLKILTTAQMMCYPALHYLKYWIVNNLIKPLLNIKYKPPK